MRRIFLHGSLNIVLTTEKSLQNDVVNTRPEQVHVDTDLLEVLAESSERPLVTVVVLLSVLVLDEPVVLLIDRVVREMHVLVLLVYLLGVRLGSKASETLLVHINTQRLVAGNHDVDA